MKIITGIFKNKNLYLPNKTNFNIKPVSSRLKKSIYDLIQFDIKNKEILDLFAGSGQLGVEALSRGAKHVTFVDNSTEAIELITKNTNFINDKFLFKIYKSEYFTFIKKTNNKFDVIFLDPPYYKNILNDLLIILSKLNIFSENSIIILKNSITESITIPNRFNIFKEKKYGNNKITIIKVQTQK